MNELFSESPASFAEANERPAPPFGGWLILIGIGLVLSLLQNLSNLVRIVALAAGPAWPRLTDPASPRYHPYWRVVIIYELIAACIYFGMNLVAVILFSLKRRAFPIFTVILIPLTFVMGLADHYLVGLIPAMVEAPAHTRGAYVLAAKFVMLHVWIPYLLLSKRVKATFIR
jgi:hypothetical protein